VPAAWRLKIDGFLKKMGYRFVLQELTHVAQVRPGELLPIRSLWVNRGVAPIYRPWPLAYRLRSGDGRVVAAWKSSADPRRWVPGTHELKDLVTIPSDIPPGTYPLDVAILTEDESAAHVQLAIAGKRPDGWYPVSFVKIRK